MPHTNLLAKDGRLTDSGCLMKTLTNCCQTTKPCRNKSHLQGVRKIKLKLKGNEIIFNKAK